MQPVADNDRRANRVRRSNASEEATVSPIQRAFWQAITVGELETIRVLLENRDIDVNKVDLLGEQRQGCTALHLAILEMPTWKTEGRNEGRNGVQSAEFVKKFFNLLLDHGADIEKPCQYTGEWYLQTAAGKTKSFYPDGYDALGLVLQFVEITRGAEVISTNVTKRLELIRDLLLERIQRHEEILKSEVCRSLVDDMSSAFHSGNFSDVDLVSDNEIISAHRVVLAARSPVFAAMFGSDNFRESKTRRIPIEETDPITLKIFVQFLYEDKLDEGLLASDFQLCHNLIMLANRYDVQPLKEKCSDIVKAKHLNPEKAANILKIADQNQVANLREIALEYISANINQILPTQDFRALDSEMIQEVLRTVVTDRPVNKRVRSSKLTPSKRPHAAVDEITVRAPPNNGEEADEEEDPV